ncbi:MAG: OmpH family outer membrane protein [Candidatus Eremiobacteraeota bacterium]|nr:OmpH family outer membrane protein [Candidatus Eremiobacteraeota bacterium]
MKTQRLAFLLAAAMLAGCAARSPIGLVDVQRIVANWPEYQGYQNQLYADERSIQSRRESNRRKQQAAMQLQRKYANVTDQLSKQIRDAAGRIASERRLTLVLTREGIGYGGVDITPDVEKALNITEKATPTPGT